MDIQYNTVYCKMTDAVKVVSPAFLLVVNWVSPALAFWHQGQSDTAGHGLVRHCPAMIVATRCTNWLFSIPVYSYILYLGQTVITAVFWTAKAPSVVHCSC
jgi:hypothetical protein